MPLPRPLPIRLRFIPLPTTKKSATSQPDHFKWKFVKGERPVLFQPEQFKDELGAIGRWFHKLNDGKSEGGAVDEAVKSEEEKRALYAEESRNGMRKARELAALNEEAWLDIVTGTVKGRLERGLLTVGPGGKVQNGKKKRDLMKEALIRKAALIRRQNEIKKRGIEEVDGDSAEANKGKGGNLQVQGKEVKKEDKDEYDCNKYQKKKRPAGHKRRIGRELILSLRSTWLSKAKEVDAAYWEPFGDLVVPLEKISRTPNGEGQGKDSVRFERFEAPLFVFLAWNKRKLRDPGTYQPNIDLYLAQHSLRHLPEKLQEDLKPPELLNECNLSVASSSLWMGVPPTDTPLHKDPDSNFFVQLAGRKKVRMIAPEAGHLAYLTVRNIVAGETGAVPFSGKFQDRTFSAHEGKMRGDEMMTGLERKLLDSLIWGDDHGVWSWEEGQKVAKWYKTAPRKFDPDDTKQESDANEDSCTIEKSGAGEEADAIKEISTNNFQEAPPKKGHDIPPNDNGLPTLTGFQTELGPGDGCYIPTGWWHSFRSIPESPLGINASVNWWFRAGKPKKSVVEKRLRKENSHLDAEERERLERWANSAERGSRRRREIAARKERSRLREEGKNRGSKRLVRERTAKADTEGVQGKTQPEPRPLIRNYWSGSPIMSR